MGKCSAFEIQMNCKHLFPVHVNNALTCRHESWSQWNKLSSFIVICFWNYWSAIILFCSRIIELFPYTLAFWIDSYSCWRRSVSYDSLWFSYIFWKLRVNRCYQAPWKKLHPILPILLHEMKIPEPKMMNGEEMVREGFL